MRVLLVLTLLVACLALSSCWINQDFVRAMDGFASVVLPEYIKYVDADSGLSEDSKAIRRATATSMKAVIDEAKE